MELWTKIPDTKYAVSSKGRVKSYFWKKRQGRFLKQGLTTDGYPVIWLRINNKKVTIRVHQLVANYFIGKPDDIENWEVNHKDGNKKNNIVSNLEYCTHAQNISHAYKELGNGGGFGKGERCIFSKLTDKEVIEIRSLSFTQKELAIIFGVSQTTISAIKRRKTWTHLL